VEHDKSLETRAIISELTDAVKNKVDNLLSDGVVTTGIVVGSVLFSRNQLFRVIDLTICSSTNLIDDSWLKIDEDCTWDVLACSGLREECVECVLCDAYALI
jgi:hypothetical protein